MATIAPHTLTGTPVVPGIAHGPALLARTEVSADGHRRLRRRRVP